jgi:uncharacterized protein (DUF2141 family)
MPVNLFILILFLSLSSFQTPLVLKIEIKGLKNSEGQVLLELSDAEKNLIDGFKQTIDHNSCTITIKNLSAGEYAFRYFHDENSNDELDANLIGIPKEGFGFSNNAKGTFGPPSYKKMIFELTGDTVVVCNPLYLK